LQSKRGFDVDGVYRAPADLCFPSSTDWWGQWKKPMKAMPDVPEHVSLLEAVGVVRAPLRESTSLAFFDWLSTQPSGVQREHRQQIVRHWNERKSGPSRWIRQRPERLCIPVYDSAGKFELFSLKQVTAQRSRVFVPDFKELQQGVLANTPRVRLTIIDAPKVDGNIIDVLRLVGVPSLREAAARPVRLLTSSETTSEPELDRELSLVRSGKVLKALPKRLPLHDVPSSALRHSWRQFVGEIAGVRVASSLTAVFSLFSRDYEVAVTSGFDQKTKYICVDKRADHRMEFFSALAAYIFEVGSSPLFEYGLMKAVHSTEQTTLFDELSDAHVEESDEPETGQDSDSKIAPNEHVEKGHHGFREKADSTRSRASETNRKSDLSRTR
jgi:hypothetical protein